MSEVLVLVGIALAMASGLPGLLLDRSSLSGQVLALALATLGNGFGLCGLGVYLVNDDSQPIGLPWSIPGGECRSMRATGRTCRIFTRPAT